MTVGTDDADKEATTVDSPVVGSVVGTSVVTVVGLTLAVLMMETVVV